MPPRPRIPPGFHIIDMPGSASLLVYDHPASVCREAGIAVPSPMDFPDVDYDPQPGDDRDPQIPQDVVECWLR